MNKQNFDINKLRVASPCSVGWETMSGDERVRRCNSCELNIYNVAEMTKNEVESLIVNREGRVCIRLFRRADGTILTKDCPIGFRAYQKRAARFAGAALATILGLFSVSFGQQSEKNPANNSKTKIVQTATPSEESVLKGQISDSVKNAIFGAEVKLTDENKKEYLTKSDNAGKYQISYIPAGIYDLEIKLAGFITSQITQIKIDKNQQNSFDIILNPDPTVTITVGGIVEFPKTNNSINFIKLAPASPPKKRKKHRVKN